MSDVALGQGRLSTTPKKPLSVGIAIPADNSGWTYTKSESVAASLRLVTDRQTIIDASEWNAGGEWTVSGVRLGAEASYVSSVTTSQYSVDIVLSVYVSTGFKIFKDQKLTPTALGLLGSDPNAFALAYGDAYCVEEEYGGVLFFAGTYFSGSQVLTREMRDSIAANAVYWGAWAEVSQKLTQIHSKETLNFYLGYDGPVFDLPDSAILSDPSKFITSVNAWIQKARANTPDSTVAIPIRHYFNPYTAVSNLGGLEPKAADFQSFYKLQRQAEKGRDRANAILQIRGNRDSFAPIDQTNLDKLSDETQQFNSSCDDANEKATAHPLDPVTVPIFPATALPDLNQFSIEAIHDRLRRGKKVTITVERPVPMANYRPPLQVIKPKIKYDISYDLGTNTWFGYPVDQDEVQPYDVRTVSQAFQKGTLWLWFEPFYYDNRLGLKHIATKGTIESVEI
jgi:hypothetical protein